MIPIQANSQAAVSGPVFEDENGVYFFRRRVTAAKKYGIDSSRYSELFPRRFLNFMFTYHGVSMLMQWMIGAPRATVMHTFIQWLQLLRGPAFWLHSPKAVDIGVLSKSHVLNWLLFLNKLLSASPPGVCTLTPDAQSFHGPNCLAACHDLSIHIPGTQSKCCSMAVRVGYF